MASQEFQATEQVETQYAEEVYEKANDFFDSPPLEFSPVTPSEISPVGARAAAPTSLATDASIATEEGSVQFHLIGQQPQDPQWSGIMNENQSNLLAMGGLVHNYMQRNYPTVNTSKLDINTWKNVVGNLPSLSMGRTAFKRYNNQITGVNVSGEFLSLVAKAIITSGSSLLLDFTSFLGSMGNIVFSATTQAQTYKLATCTYHSYLVNNGVGGYFDYGSIVLKEIDFRANFMELKGACTTTRLVNINMEYNEIVSLVQTAPIREGGRFYRQFQNLIDADATERFENAANFFNGGNTPQNDIRPQV